MRQVNHRAEAEPLLQAGLRLYGPQADNVGREVTFTHEVVAAHKVSIVRHDISLIKKRIVKEEMFNASAYTIRESTLGRFDEIGLDTEFVAEIAESQLEPGWVLAASARRLRAMAGLLVESRVIVLAFQKMELDIALATETATMQSVGEIPPVPM
jgi:hypothetical protein